MKRILAIAMCLALMLTSFVFVSAEADVTLTVETVEGPFAKDDEIVIIVDITEYYNAYSTITLEFSYDKSLLELDDIAQGSGVSGGLGTGNAADAMYGLIASPSKEREAAKLRGGDVCELYFYALADINVSVPVTVTAKITGHTNGAGDNWTASRTLTVDVVNGGIYVPGGDVHECTPSGDIQYDANNHWYICGGTDGCGNKVQEVPHSGGTATCKAKAECSVCGAEYGALNANNHAGQTEVRGQVAANCGNAGYSGDTYCLDCGVKIATGQTVSATGKHTGGEATCSKKAECTVCGQEYGALATNVHKNTKTINAKVADCGNDGYTGDTYCNDCKKTIATGQTIPSTGEHAGGEATCISKAVCTGCSNEYGSIDSKNHKNTQTINAKAADCGNAGYTGDTYCNDCQKTVATGKTIPATGNHTGGEATCCAKAQCSVCGQQYGALDANNHKGETEIRNQSAIYSGDTYCLDCDKKIASGELLNPDAAIGNVIVSSATGKKGDTVTVTVSLGENTSVAAYGAILVYDETVLQLIAMEKGSFCEDAYEATGKAIGYANENVTSGTLFTATFKILKVTGEYTVSVEFDSDSTATAELIPVAMNVTPGTVTVYCEHEGGTATCCTKAVCVLCGAEYGDFNADNHEGETEVRDDVEADCGNAGYTGDTYCLGCNEKIADGEVIPATGNHTGGTATCCTKATCGVCGAEYGDLNAENHAGGTEIRGAVTGNCGTEGYTGDTYCLGCGEKIADGETIPANENHGGGTATCCTKAVCSVCGAEYGDFDADNHEGETEVRDDVEADCGNAGYTGDTYCLGCNEKIADGEVIPATGNHTGGTATCCTKATCGVCGAEYGDFDADNHEGETEVRDDVEADCGNAGYTGDTYCLGCGEMIDEGETIPATGAHTGGTATCCAKAECSVCGQEYGDFDADNHEGETEVRDDVAADCGNAGYTGDTYCLGCGEMIDEGETIPATGAHTGGTATCHTKAECSVCGAEYGDFDADNHEGETEIRDASATYTGDTYCLGCGEMIAEGEAITPPPAGLLGDVDGNGKVNAFDAMFISQYYAKLDPANFNEAVADVDGNGKINAFDAMYVSQYYAKLIDKFPAEQ